MFLPFLLQQPRSTLADINRHLPGHVHVDYSLTDGQQLVRDVAGRRRVMELMMRSSDQVQASYLSQRFLFIILIFLSHFFALFCLIFVHHFCALSDSIECAMSCRSILSLFEDK
jgi:hypothetical protein